MTYCVHYLCTYRPVWYEDGDYANQSAAIARARMIAMQRRTNTRVMDFYGRIVWFT